MQPHQILHKARQNGSVAANCFGARLNVDELVRLLAASGEAGRHPAIRRNARILLDRMAESPWVITAGSHAGGFGGQGRPADETSHITLRVGRNNYHLRQDGRGHLFQITGPGLDEIPPWTSPGAPIP